MTWPAETGPSRLDTFLRDLRRAVAWRRRLLAAGLFAGAMALGLHVLSPPPPAGTEVLVAARDLPAGATLSGDDLRLAHRATAAVPAGALTRAAAATGRQVASAVRRGEVLTDVRLVGASSLRGMDPGLVAAPVRIADADAAALLKPGDVVDVLAAGAPTADGSAGEARLVASSLRVLSVPRPDGGRLGADLGDGALLLLATSAPTAARLAAAAVSDRLSVVLRGP